MISPYDERIESVYVRLRRLVRISRRRSTLKPTRSESEVTVLASVLPLSPMSMSKLWSSTAQTRRPAASGSSSTATQEAARIGECCTSVQAMC